MIIDTDKTFFFRFVLRFRYDRVTLIFFIFLFFISILIIYNGGCLSLHLDCARTSCVGHRCAVLFKYVFFGFVHIE